MVWRMSSIRDLSSSSTTDTGCALTRSSGSPYIRTARAGISRAPPRRRGVRRRLRRVPRPSARPVAPSLGLSRQHLDDRGFRELHLGVFRDAQHRLGILEPDHGADDAARGDDPITLLEILEHAIEL